MSEIDLQDLIYQVKKDLLMPNPKETRQDPYPLFYKIKRGRSQADSSKFCRSQRQ